MGRSLTGATSCTCRVVGIMLVDAVVTVLVGVVDVVAVVAVIIVTITIVTTTHCFLPLVCT